MLAKNNRLKKTKEIERVVKEGRKIVSRNFLVYFLSENTYSYPRFAFSVSKKVAKKAVLRNKIKRWLREITRKEIIPTLKINADFLVVAKKEIIEANYQIIEKELKETFKKINQILHNKNS